MYSATERSTIVLMRVDRPCCTPCGTSAPSPAAESTGDPKQRRHGCDPAAVRRRLPSGQPGEPGVHRLADLGFERALHADNGSTARAVRADGADAASSAERSLVEFVLPRPARALCMGADERDPAPRREQRRAAPPPRRTMIVAMRPATAAATARSAPVSDRAEPHPDDVARGGRRRRPGGAPERRLLLRTAAHSARGERGRRERRSRRSRGSGRARASR